VTFRVLIVEDSVTQAAAVMQALASAIPEGAVSIAATEDDGIELLFKQPHDLVVIDLQLAQGTGFGVIRAARDLVAKPTLAVFTNHAVPALKVAAFEAGADYFLDKAKGVVQVVGIAREIASKVASA
jgi:DNA-binding response OmpR family regulator